MNESKESPWQAIHDTLDKLTDWSVVEYVPPNCGLTNYSFTTDQGSAKMVLGGVILGLVLGLTIPLGFIFPSYWRLWCSIALQCIYHLMEFLMTAHGQPTTLGYHSFLFYHSFDYSVSRLVFITEFFLWFFLLPTLVSHPIAISISILGLAFTLCGQIIRTSAMYTAGKSFTHEIATSYKPEHRLITHGVYAYFRHPSYFGWYVWAVSMQLLLFTPISLIAALVASHLFFKDRIEVEEGFLLEFFGAQFETYAKRVPTRIPLIPGLVFSDH